MTKLFFMMVICLIAAVGSFSVGNFIEYLKERKNSKDNDKFTN